MSQRLNQPAASPPDASPPEPGVMPEVFPRVALRAKAFVQATLRRIEGNKGVGIAAIVGLLLAELVFLLVATAHPWGAVANGRFALRSGAAGPFAHLASGLPKTHAFIKAVLLVLLAAMSICYLTLLAVRRIPWRWVVVVLGGSYLLLALVPPLLSKDVYLYLAYSHIGVSKGLNPYVSAPSALHGHLFNLLTWHHQVTPYGPIFTLATYPLALTSLSGALWLIKLATIGAALGCVALVWKCAQLLDRPAITAALAVGLNPLFLLYATGGSHNDLLMVLALLAGLYLALAARERLSGLASVVAIGVKLAAAPMAPFVLLAAPNRRRAITAAAIAGVALVASTLVIFGPHVLGVGQQANTVTRFSIPRLLGAPFGVRPNNSCAVHPTHCHAGALNTVATVILGLIVIGLLVWVLRGADPVTGAGWAAAALIVTLTSVQPWYFVWLLPLAVLSTSRRLLITTACLGVYLLITAWPTSTLLTPLAFHKLF